VVPAVWDRDCRGLSPFLALAKTAMELVSKCPSAQVDASIQFHLHQLVIFSHLKSTGHFASTTSSTCRCATKYPVPKVPNTDCHVVTDSLLSFISLLHSVQLQRLRETCWVSFLHFYNHYCHSQSSLSHHSHLTVPGAAVVSPTLTTDSHSRVTIHYPVAS